MRIILSRKGFDGGAGGHASPILPDGTMLSLPIPSSLDSIDYGSLPAPGGRTIRAVISDLNARAKIECKGAHVDPDLIAGMRERKAGWLPSLGQIRGASTHLRSQNVQVGDLFLFYGWFRYVDEIDGRLSFRPKTNSFHAIYGYLKIGDIVNAHRLAELPTWLHDHPHANIQRLAQSTNTIYLASQLLDDSANLPGAGVFKLRNALVLTKQGFSRSRWSLDPKLFRHLQISHHTDKAWKNDYFQSQARGQEYVIHADERAERWAYNLIGGSQRWEL